MGLISRVSSRTYRKFEKMEEELNQALDKAIKLATDLQTCKSDSNNKYHGEPILDAKLKTFAAYQKTLVEINNHKASGKSLVEIEDLIYDTTVKRTILERIRPLEMKVQPRIDKLIKTYEEGGSLSKSDPRNFRPNLLGDSDDSEEDDSADGEDENQTETAEKSDKIYRPPKLVSVP